MGFEDFDTDFHTDFPTLVPAVSPLARLNRRQFVGRGIGTGFAAAVLPVSAQTIKTSSAGLLTGEVTVPVNGFQMPAYRAAPAGRTGLPLVLVVSEVFGVHEYIADVANRLAQAGYFAVAPELFVRQGDAAGYGEIAKLLAEVVNQVPDAQVMADLDATLAWARAEGADTRKTAITGFCWGGRITWLYCAHNPGVKAGVAWYGRLVGTPSTLTPTHPVDVAARLAAPVLGLYGGQDAGIPMDTVAQMKTALARGSAAAQQCEFVVYPDAPHAFHADYRPSYRQPAAEDGWRRTLAWFKANGVS